MQAAAAAARGRVELASGDVRAARRTLRTALRKWSEVNAPFEAARVRMSLAEVNRAGGDEEAAIEELTTAHSILERLGARLEARRAVELGAAIGARPTTVTRTFMFTDIVRSTDLAAAIGDGPWQQLKRWHDERVASLVAAHGGEVVDGTGDGFFLAFPDAASSLGAAVAIQRTLADHRRTAGFAPQIRIGVHVADAMQDAGRYSGLGIHAAARIAAQAGPDQILASAATLDAAGDRFDHDAPQPVALKGFAEPVLVATVRWR
jgi:class 3 adenylate cyclase